MRKIHGKVLVAGGLTQLSIIILQKRKCSIGEIRLTLTIHHRRGEFSERLLTSNFFSIYFIKTQIAIHHNMLL